MEEEDSPEKKVEEELNDTCDHLDNQCQTQSIVQNPSQDADTICLLIVEQMTLWENLY